MKIKKNSINEVQRLVIHPSGVKVYFLKKPDGTIWVKTKIPKKLSPEIAALFQAAHGYMTTCKQRVNK